MATIMDSNMRKKEKDLLDSQVMIPDKNIMEQIYTDPQAILKDDDFLLEHVVNNGYHCSCLVEALGLFEIIIKIKDTEYKMFYQPPSPFFTHYDVMFKTDVFKKYMGKSRRVAAQIQKATEKDAIQKPKPWEVITV